MDMHFLESLDHAVAAAKAYIDAGFRVIPLYGVANGKCLCGDPACKARDGGKHEFPCQDGEWKDGRVFSHEDFEPYGNIAIAMGPWSGSDEWLVCVDVDGAESVEDIPFVPSEFLPPTLMQITPRGMHLIYTVAPYTPLGNWVDLFRTKETGISIDLRYARGRIVASPSISPNGLYFWSNWTRPAPLDKAFFNMIIEARMERGLPCLDTWERGRKAP